MRPEVSGGYSYPATASMPGLRVRCTGAVCHALHWPKRACVPYTLNGRARKGRGAHDGHNSNPPSGGSITPACTDLHALASVARAAIAFHAGSSGRESAWRAQAPNAPRSRRIALGRFPRLDLRAKHESAARAILARLVAPCDYPQRNTASGERFKNAGRSLPLHAPTP